MNNTGWFDPTWSQLYGQPSQPRDTQAQAAAPQESAFISTLQQAAAANVPLDLLTFESIDAVQPQ